MGLAGEISNGNANVTHIAGFCAEGMAEQAQRVSLSRGAPKAGVTAVWWIGGRSGPNPGSFVPCPCAGSVVQPAGRSQLRMFRRITPITPRAEPKSQMAGGMGTGVSRYA